MANKKTKKNNRKLKKLMVVSVERQMFTPTKRVKETKVY